MSKLYLQTYEGFTISGRDFPMVDSEKDPHKTIFSPNGINSVSLNFLQNDMVLFANEGFVPFEFSISRNKKMMANVKCIVEGPELLINNNWRIGKDGIKNREVHTSPTFVKSNMVHFDFRGNGTGRVDMKIGESGFAACFFTDAQLLFLRMNGNHAAPRLEEFIQRESLRLPVSQEQVERYLRLHPRFENFVGRLIESIGKGRLDNGELLRFFSRLMGTDRAIE